MLVVTSTKFALEGKLTMETITNCRLNEEIGRKKRGIPAQSKANIVENCGRNKTAREIIDEEGLREIQISL